MKKSCHLAIVFLLALVSAAIVAYAVAFAHFALGLSRSALREQALICAALIVVLLMIEMLASKET